MSYHSQIGQDIWVVEQVFRGRRDGFFFEAGAYDGVRFSNTVTLEREYGWRGICVEAATGMHAALRANRSCSIVHALLGAERGTRFFDGSRGMLSAPSESPTPGAVSMNVQTVADVLDACEAPEVIDYLSLDIEGGEDCVLLSFPFDRYRFGCLSVELKVADARHEAIRAHMAGVGYRFVGRLFADSFFVHRDITYDLPESWFEEELARRIDPRYWSKPELAHVGWIRDRGGQA